MVKKILTVLLFFCFVSANAYAYLTKGFNVEELSERSDSIFMGEVQSVKQSPSSDHGIPYIEVEFKVYEKMKGNIPTVYSYRQFAPKHGKNYELIGMDKSSYKVGDKVVVFLGGPSKAGFSAPIDFQLFKLLTKSNRQQDLDHAIIVNQQFGVKANQDLFKNLKKKKTIEVKNEIDSKNKKSASQQNHMNFGDFRKLIRASVEP